MKSNNRTIKKADNFNIDPSYKKQTNKLKDLFNADRKTSVKYTTNHFFYPTTQSQSQRQDREKRGSKK